MLPRRLCRCTIAPRSGCLLPPSVDTPTANLWLCSFEGGCAKFLRHLTALCMLYWLRKKVVPWLRGDEWLHKGCEGMADGG